jgi:outer membrane protein assembly factor BamA
MVVRSLVVAGVCLACAARGSQAHAQTSQVPHPSPKWLNPASLFDPNRPVEAPVPKDQTSDGTASATTRESQTPGRFSAAQRWLSRFNGTRDGWTPRVGNITSGSGIAFGQTYQWPVLNGAARVTTDAMFSVRGYHVLEVGAFRPFRDQRMAVGARIRHEGYPQEDFYGLGQGSSRGDHTSYLREGLDTSAFVTFAPRRWLNIEASAGFLDMRIGGGRQNGVPSIEERFDAATAPGLGADGDMVHAGLALEIDRRDDTFFPRSGGRYYAGVNAFHGLSDVHDFTRADVDVRQYFAVPKTTNHVIAVRSQFAFSGGAGDSAVPFYMLPRLGGSNTLRGYESSRFTDEHAMAFSAEYRWRLSRKLQLVGFADAGQVAPDLNAFELSTLRTSFGAGIRYRIKKTVARLDFAAGQEGTRWIIGFGPSF